MTAPAYIIPVDKLSALAANLHDERRHHAKLGPVLLLILLQPQVNANEARQAAQGGW